MIDMAIVKANYTKSNGSAKANIRYIQHRKGKDGATIVRTLFGSDGTMNRGEAYQMIDEAEKNIKFFRFVLNPDPQKENAQKNLDLWKVTQDFMLKVRDKRGAFQFVAVEHNDHTDKPHIHAVCLLSGKVTKADLASFRQMGREVALSQREALESAKEKRHQLSFIKYAAREYKSQQNISKAGEKAVYIRKARQPTLSCPQGGMHSIVKIKGTDGKYYCPVHKRVYEQELGLSL